MTILDRYVLPKSSIGGLKISELSGLAWDEDDRVLYAVSDKGRLFHFELSLENDRIKSLRPTYGAHLMGPDNVRLSKRTSNAEGLDIINGRNGVRGDSELLIVTETGPTIGRYTTSGRMRVPVPVPDPLVDPAKYVTPERGLESVAFHPQYGVVTAPERPLPARAQQGHVLYSNNGRTIPVGHDLAGEADIKAIEVLPDGRIVTLERLRSADWTSYRMFLRITSPDNCPEQGTCKFAISEIFPTPLPDTNFEGLARISSGTFLAVSDDIVANERRTVFVLFRIQSPQ